MNTQAIQKALRAIDRLKNCGIGPGGFQPGNTCARGGGGKLNSPPDKKLGQIKYPAGPRTENQMESLYNEFILESGGDIESDHGRSEIGQAIANQGANRVVLRDFSKPNKPIVGAVSFSKNDDLGKSNNFVIGHLGSTGEVKGTGKELVRYVLERAAKENIGVIFESTPNAEGFYRRLGFRHLDENQSKLMGINAEEVKVMKKKLGSPGRGK